MKRRNFLAGAAAPALLASPPASTAGPDFEELGRMGSAPVLKLDGITSPVIIDSIRFLKKGTDVVVRVRSKDGAEGVSLANLPRQD